MGSKTIHLKLYFLIDFFYINIIIYSDIYKFSLYSLIACLTQSVEYRFCKPKVIGSTPIASFILFNTLISLV